MIAVPGCWFDAGERAVLAERGGALAYCPGSNMFLGDGVTDLVDLVARGVPVGLGTDGGCSKNRVTPFDTVRTAAVSGRRDRALLRCRRGRGRSRRSVVLAGPGPGKEHRVFAVTSRHYRRR